MRETITMTRAEQRRAWVLGRLLGHEMTVAEAAQVLGLSDRSVRRLRARLERDGPGGLVHGNRGRPSRRRLPEAARDRILALATEDYAGINDTHLSELLAEREGILISRAALQRLLRGAGRRSPRKRRGPRHRSRRDRMPREGLLLQTDGSRHDWLEDRGPRLTLVGVIDDATGRLTGATFRDQEDTAGYLAVLADTLRRHGVPGAVYHDRHTIFEPPEREPLTLEEQLLDARLPTQLGRTFAELGIGSVSARSPQAKGRIERLWGTLQDRLVTELRLAGVVDREAANAYLASYLPRFNRRFAVPAADPAPAWRPLPAGLAVERVCCLKYRRTVARDGTVRAGATILQLPGRANGRSRAGQRVELHLRLDGRMVIWDGTQELATTPAPLDAVQLRALDHARVELGSKPRSAASATSPAADHPWRRPFPRRTLDPMVTTATERTDSLSS
jgi:transposase